MPRRPPGIAVVRTYGMSETAGGCVYDGVRWTVCGCERGPTAGS